MDRKIYCSKYKRAEGCYLTKRGYDCGGVIINNPETVSGGYFCIDKKGSSPIIFQCEVSELLRITNKTALPTNADLFQ